MVALWQEGPLQRHLLGAPKLGTEQLEIQAYRCTACGYVALFAPEPD